MYTQFVAVLLLFINCNANDYYYHGYNVSRTTQSAIGAYRSALTLDWLAAADARQRAVVDMYDEEHRGGIVNTECIAYPRPSPGKIGRYMLELLRNLEGDDGTIIRDLIQSLIRSSILVETSAFEVEPNLDSLVKTPEIMMAEPHATFPRILSMVWMSVTDPSSVKKHGWCSINKVSQYLSQSRPYDVAKHMRTLDSVVDRARFIMEDFILHITPLTAYQTRNSRKKMMNDAGQNSKQQLNTEHTKSEVVNHFQIVDTAVTSVSTISPAVRINFVKSDVPVKKSPRILAMMCLLFVQ